MRNGGSTRGHELQLPPRSSEATGRCPSCSEPVSTADKWTDTLSFEEPRRPSFLANCSLQTKSSNSQKQEEAWVGCSPWGNSPGRIPTQLQAKTSPSANAGKSSWEEKVAGTCPGRLGLVLTGPARKERTDLLTEKLGLMGHTLSPEFILYRAGRGLVSAGEQISNCKQARLQLLVSTQPATVCAGQGEALPHEPYLGKALPPSWT